MAVAAAAAAGQKQKKVGCSQMLGVEPRAWMIGRVAVTATGMPRTPCTHMHSHSHMHMRMLRAAAHTGTGTWRAPHKA